MPVEPGRAATAESNGTRSACRHREFPRHLTEEGPLGAASTSISSVDISSSFSLRTKCSSCAALKKSQKSRSPRSVSLINNFILLSAEAANLHSAINPQDDQVRLSWVFLATSLRRRRIGPLYRRRACPHLDRRSIDRLASKSYSSEARVALAQDCWWVSSLPDHGD